MSKRRTFQGLIIGLSATVLFLFFLEQNQVFGRSDAGTRGPDAIMIDLPSVKTDGQDQMPPVTFLHDLHTGALEGKTCSTCHPEEFKKPVFKFMRLKDTSTEVDMNVYHDNCTSCHDRIRAEGKIAGPEQGQCRACHSGAGEDTGQWHPINLDASLHQRHAASTSISPVMGSSDTRNCSACHHRYDDKTGKLTFIKGTEESCRYCHKDEATEKVSSLRTASHKACVSCHQDLVTQNKTAGPINCRGCHDLLEQKQIKRLTEIPRIDRNQPDQVVLTGWDASAKDVDARKSAAEKAMKPVLFNHVAHETMGANCRTCHHESLEACSTCHTAEGADKGGQIRLEQAMHANGADNTCVGCHKKTTAEAADCAGCHAQMPEKSFNDTTCIQCHNLEKQVDLDKKGLAALALELSGKDATMPEPVPADKIPETITIGHLSKTYEPSEFPHGKIIRALNTRLEKSSLAKAFHGEGKTMCMGCHHNSPASEKPQNCGSCHGKTPSLKDGRPGLMGAYHGQCISCHESMKLKSITATDCIKCHRQKS